MILNIIILTLVIIIIFILINNKDFFSTASGYGFSSSKKTSKSIYVSLVPIEKSLDLKLLSLVNKLKYSIIKPPNHLDYTGTEKGLIGRTPEIYSNIILIPGLSDCTLKQNNSIVWPHNCNQLKKNVYTAVDRNKNTHFGSVITLLKALKYTEGDKLNTLNYNFIQINLKNIVENLKSLLKKNTVIIAYDFGAVIANLAIQHLDVSEKKLINKLLFVCPTIGGVPLSLKEFFSGNTILRPENTQQFDSTMLSFPNEKFFENPVMIYKSTSYNAKSIPKMINNNYKSEFDSNIYLELQERSFINPEIETIIVGCTGLNTPTCYDYKNNLDDLPERHLPKNYSNNNSSSIPQETYIGLQTNGDSVVPLQSIEKLHSLWKNNSTLEIIREKNHYTILKSYELGLIIISLV